MFANRRETGATTDRYRSKGKSAAIISKWLISLAILPISIVGVTFSQEGFVAAGRGATMMVLPTGIVWLVTAAIMSVALIDRHWTKAAVAGVLFLIWSVVGNGGFSNWIIGQVESPLTDSPTPAFEQRVGELEPFDAIVTLGGSAGLKTDHFAEMNGDGERLVSAAQAYHAEMTRTIITTGSSTNGIGNPSEISRELLISLGVPPAAIFEIPGANTQQEMQSLIDFLASPPESWSDRIEERVSPRVGLITSAFHMPRAMRLAKSQELELIPLPCAFRHSRTNQPWKASDWIPTADAQSTIGVALKEMLAFVLGR